MKTLTHKCGESGSVGWACSRWFSPGKDFRWAEIRTRLRIRRGEERLGPATTSRTVVSGAGRKTRGRVSLAVEVYSIGRPSQRPTGCRQNAFGREISAPKGFCGCRKNPDRGCRAGRFATRGRPDSERRRPHAESANRAEGDAGRPLPSRPLPSGSERIRGPTGGLPERPPLGERLRTGLRRPAAGRRRLAISPRRCLR